MGACRVWVPVVSKVGKRGQNFSSSRRIVGPESSVNSTLAPYRSAEGGPDGVAVVLVDLTVWVVVGGGSYLLFKDPNVIREKEERLALASFERQ